MKSTFGDSDKTLFPIVINGRKLKNNKANISHKVFIYENRDILLLFIKQYSILGNVVVSAT